MSSYYRSSIRGSLEALGLKGLPATRETRVRSLGREDPLEKAVAPTPVLLPGESQGLGSPVGCSPWGRKESDTTERLHFTLGLHRLLAFLVKISATSVRGDNA